jgi:hypothetical protein
LNFLSVYDICSPVFWSVLKLGYSICRKRMAPQTLVCWSSHINNNVNILSSKDLATISYLLLYIITRKWKRDVVISRCGTCWSFTRFIGTLECDAICWNKMCCRSIAFISVHNPVFMIQDTCKSDLCLFVKLLKHWSRSIMFTITDLQHIRISFSASLTRDCIHEIGTKPLS